MALISIFPKPSASTPETQSDGELAASGGFRGAAMQRLQIGIAGVALMILLVGLAQVILDRAKESEAAAVPAAASTVAPDNNTSVQNDPLAEAGIVPDLLSEPDTARTQEPAIMPEQGGAAAPQ